MMTYNGERALLAFVISAVVDIQYTKSIYRNSILKNVTVVVNWF